MKKIVFLAAIVLLATNLLQGQPWSKLMSKDKAKKEFTLFDYQNAFNEYWKPYDVKNGYYFDAKGEKHKALGWKQFKRWEYFWEARVNPNTGEFPKTSAAEEFHKHVAKFGQYCASKESWVSLGTSSSTGGYAGIGRINTIAFHPSDDNVFWIGAASGGLWATTDGGSSWTTTTDNLDVLGVSAIVVPSNFETSNTLYIGTGDRDAHDNNSNGVLKSTDGGNTWSPTGLSFQLSFGETVNRMHLSPENDQAIFAATSDGFYKTSNGADTWDLLFGGEFIDFELCQGYPDTMFACTRNGQFFRTVDGGQNWVQVHSSNSGQRVEMAVSADQPNVVYAIASNSANGLEAIYKSIDFGATYTNIFDSYNLMGWNSNGGDSGGQGWYDLSLAADPNDGDIVYAGGVNTWRSTDGGYSWEIVSHWSGNGAPAVHADKHWLGYRHNTSVLFECNDGGVYISTDGENFDDLTNGMTISQIYRLGVAQTHESYTMTGLQDNGSKFYSGSYWDDVIGGDGMECLIDFTNENIQYGSLYYGDIYKTTNTWGNSTNITNNIPGGATGAWVTPYCLDPDNHNTIYVGMSTLWKSTDQGNSFSGIGNFGSDLRSLAVAPSNSNVIYAATYTSISKTTDGGSSWNTITSGLPLSGSSLKYISVKENNANTLWVALSGYNGNGVFESTDGGTSWVNISSGLPSVPVNCVIQNKFETAEIQLYAGTDYGVYIKNGSEDWTLYSNGLPNVVVNELEIYYNFANPPASRLRAATYGRGLWEADLQLSGSYAPYVSTSLPINITATSAELTGEIVNDFGDEVNESGIVYSTEPSPQIGGANSTAVQTNPLVTEGEFTVSIEDLEPATTYYFSAYAINTNGTGYGGAQSFTTECVIFSNLPYTEDFEDLQTIPVCWSQIFLEGEDLPWIISIGNGGSISNAHSGAFNLLLKDNSVSANKTLLVLPVFDVSSLVQPALKFWIAKKAFMSNIDELRVLYKNSATAEWTEIGQFNEVYEEWTEEAVAIPEVAESCYLAFEGNALWGAGICIDDIVIEELNAIESIEGEYIRIYPNPANEIVTIEVGDDYLNAELQLLDLTGKKIDNQIIVNKKTQLNLGSIQSGIYILRIIGGKNVVQTKIIVE